MNHYTTYNQYDNQYEIVETTSPLDTSSLDTSLQLESAIESLDMDKIKHVLNTSPNIPDVLNPSLECRCIRSYPFRKVIETGNLELTKLFIEYGAKYDHGFMPACHAICHNKLDNLRLFIDIGLDLFASVSEKHYLKIMRTYYGHKQYRFDIYQNFKYNILLILCCRQDLLNLFEEYYMNNPNIGEYKLSILRFAAQCPDSRILDYALDTYSYTNLELLNVVNDLLHSNKYPNFNDNSNLIKITKCCADHELSLITSILTLPGFTRDLIEFCLEHFAYTSSQLECIIQIYIQRGFSFFVDEAVHCQIIQLFYSRHIDITPITGKLIIHAYTGGCKEIIRVLREHNTNFQWVLVQASTTLSEFIDSTNE